MQALALKRLDLSAEGDARSSAPVDSVAKFAIEESIIKDISLNDRKAKAGAKWHQTRCHQRLFKKRVTTVYRRAIGLGLARLNHGRRVGGFDADVFRSFTDGRYVSSSQDVSLVRDPDLLKSLQNMMEELESSRQSRLRAWEALQKIRATLSDLAGIAIAPPPRKIRVLDVNLHFSYSNLIVILGNLLTQAVNPALAAAQNSAPITISGSGPDTEKAKQDLNVRGYSFSTKPAEGTGGVTISFGSNQLTGYDQKALDAALKSAGYPKTADPSKINYVAAIPVLWVLVIYEASRPVISTQRWKSGME